MVRSRATPVVVSSLRRRGRPRLRDGARRSAQSARHRRRRRFPARCPPPRADRRRTRLARRRGARAPRSRARRALRSSRPASSRGWSRRRQRVRPHRRAVSRDSPSWPRGGRRRRPALRGSAPSAGRSSRAGSDAIAGDHRINCSPWGRATIAMLDCAAASMAGSILAGANARAHPGRASRGSKSESRARSCGGAGWGPTSRWAASTGRRGGAGRPSSTGSRTSRCGRASARRG